MRIDGTRFQPTNNKASSRSAGSGARFSIEEPDTPEPTKKHASAPAAANVQHLDALLGLQTVADDDSQDRRAKRHGHDLLDQLEALRIDLLAGSVSAQRVANLSSLLNIKPEAADPSLGEMVDAIDLRARVELAKLGIEK